MFEKYTEKARKVIFFARYEASQFGSEYIGTEHLLLGVLREDRALTLRVLRTPEELNAIRKQIEKGIPLREKITVSVDLPLNAESKRVLKHAAEESRRLKDDHIGPEHFLLGLLLEPECTAGKILAEHGITPAKLEQARIAPSETSEPVDVPAGTFRPAGGAGVSGGVRDLTDAARSGALSPLIGRERELERIVQILSRRARNNPALIGEAGVGKNALVEGLAQRIAEGAVPENLTERRVRAIDATALLSSGQTGRLRDIHPGGILYVQGLFDLAGKSEGWTVLEAMRVLEPHLSNGVQCVATGSPIGLRMTVEKSEWLTRHFEVVPVLPPSEEEAIGMVSGVKERYEKFHGVVIAHEAVETAVAVSRWFLRHRQLPDRAIDLIDDAATRVKLRGESEPREMVEIQQRLRRIVRDMENAIAAHQFPEARAYSEEERRERQNLQRLREQLGEKAHSNTVTAEDVLEAVADRAGVMVTAVRSVLQVKQPEQLDLIAKELTAQFPMCRDWTEGLATYLAGCTADEAEKLAQAIRSAKGRLN